MRIFFSEKYTFLGDKNAEKKKKKKHTIKLAMIMMNTAYICSVAFVMLVSP